MKNKFDILICLRMGKTSKAKSHRVNLRSPLLRIHYYQSQAVTSIRNLTKPFNRSRNTNPQLNTYLNTQLDLYCSEKSLRSMHESQYVTNQWCTDPSMCLTPSTWRRFLAAKFFSSLTMKIRKLLGHKTFDIKTQ